MIKPERLKYLFAAAVVLGLLSISGLIALIVLWQKKLSPFQDYSVVVDAGSTHSKIFVYTWPADKSNGLGLTSRVTQVQSCSPTGGAITSISDPTEENIKAYFDSAMIDCMNVIPSTRKSRALIFLGGTAGLRLFEMRNATYTNALLNGTRTYFSSLDLHFKAPEQQVRIISGAEEGLSGWISANILLEELYKNNIPSQTYGVSDMGGASTQLSFYSPNATYNLYNMSLFNTEYDIYSHSYLCYGTEQFRYVYLSQIINKAGGSESINDPCLQNGFIQNFTYNDIFTLPCVRNRSVPIPELNMTSTFSIIGTGDYSQCVSNIQQRFNTSTCTYTSCGFDNIYQPKPIEPSLKFIAISAWYSTFNNLAQNVTLLPNKDGNYDFNTTSLSQIKTAISGICQQPWSQVPTPDKYRPLLCFNSMYHWTLLEYAYGMNDANLKNFHIIKTVNNNEIGWTLGYMINQTNYLEAEYRPARLLTKNEFGGLVFLCSFLLFLSVLVAIGSIFYLHRYHNYER